MSTAGSDGIPPSFSSPRLMARRTQRSDSIPEHSEAITGDLSTAAAAAADASIAELLMRHSSPLFHRATGAPVTSPMAERNSSPSPLRLNRPRSNPRSRTPMRIPEEEQGEDQVVDLSGGTTEGRRITIRLGSGSAVGVQTASYGARRNRQEQPVRVKSNKQGPSHRKARRWNNDNFVNLAAELSSSKGSGAAVEALLKGSAGASKFRSVLDPKQHESKAMKRFREDKSLKMIREQFFDGSLPCETVQSTTSKRKVVNDTNLLTPLERFHRIETRLRRIVVKACENSYAASKVVDALEEFLVRVHRGEEDERSREQWQEFLLDSPSVTLTKNSEELLSKRIIKFLFDADSSTGGFHRLLLHGVCQFHCLSATSSTIRIDGKKARVLTATGTLSGADVRLVPFITERQNGNPAEKESSKSAEEILSNNLSTLKF